MSIKNPDLYFDPVSEGLCEVLECSAPAKFRASWVQGCPCIRLVCAYAQGGRWRASFLES